MKRIPWVFFAFFAAFAAPVRAASLPYVDCGDGFVAASAKSSDGIQTFECKRVWCRDLENGRVMGADNSTVNKGYELKNKVTPEEYNYYGKNIHCFGERKWCTGEVKGEFDPDIGIYTRSGVSTGFYRGVLRGDCYYWQVQSHKCDAANGEVAVHNGTSWTCIIQASGPGTGRSAIKQKAIRRSSGVTNLKMNPKLKK